MNESCSLTVSQPWTHVDDPSTSSERSSITSGEDGWCDIEEDTEENLFVSLFDNETFTNLVALLEYCINKYEFNLVEMRSRFALGFLDTVMLINYIRSEVKLGHCKPIPDSKAVFDHPRYLQPVLENDALLYSIDDLGDMESHSEEENVPQVSQPDSPAALIQELQRKAQIVEIAFQSYKEYVQQLLGQAEKSRDVNQNSSTIQTTRPKDDSTYFESYDSLDIHEIMLKDTVRTGAYRDFIHQNKQIFEGKTVLDVGCGTGILSMMCARAGAKKVIAVDNSSIIWKATQNIYENKLEKQIICIHGKIEDVDLPVDQVDIIISEWMGHCLLYEAMCDSVLHARDQYLAPGGLMIPSHATLLIAPYHDAAFVSETVTFWDDVYGFKMSSMREHIHDEVMLASVRAQTIPASSQCLAHLPLQTITKADLTFTGRPFSVELTEDVESLDGFVIWFDIYFSPTVDAVIPFDSKAEVWVKEGNRVAFTTGPGGPATHWQQGICLIDHQNAPAKRLLKGQSIRGEVDLMKRRSNERQVKIKIDWEAESGGLVEKDVEGHVVEKGVQTWSLF